MMGPVLDKGKAALITGARAAVERLPESRRAQGQELLWRASVMRLPNRRVTRRYIRRFGLKVRRGPFAGLEFPEEVVSRNPFLTSKLIGSYEMELHPWLDRLLQRPFGLVVDVGAADGYYVAGLARALTQVQVVAYEADPLQARLARLTADRNGVGDRVDVRGLCRVDDLAGLRPDGHVLVVIDAEGAEDELLDPARVPWLRTATMLVEVHEMYAPGVTARLRERFGDTHVIEELTDRPRYRDDFPELYELPVDNLERDLAISESRTGVTPWMLLEPRT